MFEDSNSAIFDVHDNSRPTPHQSANSKKVGSGTRRGRMDLMAEILLFCEKKRVKTCIMSKTNVNYMQLKKYLDFLTVKGMLS